MRAPTLFFVIIWAMGLPVRNAVAQDKIPACGVSALYGACRLLGKTYSLEQVEGALKQVNPGVDTSQLSLYELRMGAQSLGLHALSVKMATSELNKVPTPAIMFFRPEKIGKKEKIGHYALLRNIDKDKAEVLDFNYFFNSLWIPLLDLKEIWDGECLLLSNAEIKLPRYETNIYLWIGFGILIFIIIFSAIFLRKKNLGYQVVIIAIVIGGAIGCGRTPPIEFPEKEQKCGIVFEGQMAYATFPFTITGSSPVTIRSLNSSCACMAVNNHIVGQELLPGTSHNLVMSLETHNLAGRITGTTLVETDPPCPQPLLLTMSVFVDSIPILVQATPVRGETVLGRSQEISFSVQALRHPDLATFEWDPSKSDLNGLCVKDFKSIRNKTNVGQKADDIFHEIHTWTLTPSKIFPIGKHSFDVKLAWKNQTKSLSIPIVLEVVHPIKISLNRLYFGKMVSGETRTIKIQVQGADGKKCDVKAVKCKMPFVTAEFSQTNYEISVMVCAPATEGRFQSALSIVPAEKTWPEIMVPISGVVEK